jgi:hypothetical protein
VSWARNSANKLVAECCLFTLGKADKLSIMSLTSHAHYWFKILPPDPSPHRIRSPSSHMRAARTLLLLHTSQPVPVHFTPPSPLRLLPALHAPLPLPLALRPGRRISRPSTRCSVAEPSPSLRWCYMAPSTLGRCCGPWTSSGSTRTMPRRPTCHTLKFPNLRM